MIGLGSDNQGWLDGANKIGNSSNAQRLKLLISKPRASSKYPEIKVIKEKRKNERMQGKKTTEFSKYSSPQYVYIMFHNCARVAHSKDTLNLKLNLIKLYCRLWIHEHSLWTLHQNQKKMLSIWTVSIWRGYSLMCIVCLPGWNCMNPCGHQISCW